MSEHTTQRLRMRATPEQCFAVVTDFERYPDWAADIKQVRVDETDAEGRAVKVTFRAAAFGRSTTYTLAYDYAEAPKVLSWRQTEGDITAKLDGTYVFEAADTGTEVTYHLEVELRVPIPGFIKMRAASRIMTTAMRQLKARIESSA